jgi:hypothetical protein
MFFAGEFAEIVTAAALVTTLFFGGWQVPYLLRDGFYFPWGGSILLPHLAVVLLQVGAFTLKVMFLLLAADSVALERAAISLRPGDAVGLEDALAGGAGQYHDHRAGDSIRAITR